MKHSTLINFLVACIAIIMGLLPLTKLITYNNLRIEYKNIPKTYYVYLNNTSVNEQKEETKNTESEPTNMEVDVDIKADYSVIINEDDIIALAKMLYGETNGMSSLTEKSAVVWCCLNRFDAGEGNSIAACASNRNSFNGYRKNNPITDLDRTIVEDVLYRYYIEKQGATKEEVMRTLPPDYQWFMGTGTHNIFRNKYKGNYSTWDWSLPSPYDT